MGRKVEGRRSYIYTNLSSAKSILRVVKTYMVGVAVLKSQSYMLDM
jgi:hypothetical protein